MSQKEKVVRTMFQMELTAHIEASGTNRGACRSVRTILSHWILSLGAPACRVRSSLRETLHLSVGDTAVFDTGSISPVLCTLGPRQGSSASLRVGLATAQMVDHCPT